MGRCIGHESRERFLRHVPEAAAAVAGLLLLTSTGTVPTPLWALVVLTIYSAAVISVVYSRWGRDADDEQIRARAVVQSSVLTVVSYATGWGSPLAMVHLLAVADSVRYSGSRAAKIVLQTAVVTTVAAQVGVAIGIVPSALDTLPSHAIAAFSVLILLTVGTRIQRMTRAKEIAELDLQVEEQRFRTLVQESSDVILVVSDARVTYASPSVGRVLGYTDDEVNDIKYVDVIHPDDRDAVAMAVLEMVTRPGATGLIECRLRHRDGRWIPFESSCRNLLHDPKVRGFVITGRNVTERKELEEQLEHRAFHDALTGLANRTLFRDRIEHAVGRSERVDTDFGVLYVDLDGFKVINDTLGHAVGDAVLRTVAARISQTLRPADTAARLGGDEFAVLLSDLTDRATAGRVAQRIIDALRQPITVGERTVRVDASIGVAFHEENSTGETLLRNADIAMYMAKKAGKGCYELFEPEMHLAVVERLQLEADLQRAVERDELVLHYQPIVDLDDQRIVGVEALLRWSHHERGNVSPGEFIPVAEESGLIIPIGRWVLQEACRQVAEWQDRYPTQPPLHVSVNVSMRQLGHHEFVTDVQQALVQSGLAPEHLTLELTESALVADPDAAIAVLRQLKALGVRLAVDDFGTGYSSLSYLQRFPVDVLKIDRSFVEGMVTGEQNPALVRAIVDMGHSLQLETVAEGIEHAEELLQCRALQCRLGQGYLFARPAGQDEIAVLLAEMSAGDRQVDLTEVAHDAAR